MIVLYTCSENKGADQLRGYREADLRLCFRLDANCWFSQIIYSGIQYNCGSQNITAIRFGTPGVQVQFPSGLVPIRVVAQYSTTVTATGQTFTALEPVLKSNGYSENTPLRCFHYKFTLFQLLGFVFLLRSFEAEFRCALKSPWPRWLNRGAS